MKGEQCNVLHRTREWKDGKTVCQSVVRCTRCGRTVKDGQRAIICEEVNGQRIRRTGISHSNCGKDKCMNCGKQCEDLRSHKCFLTPIKCSKPVESDSEEEEEEEKEEEEKSMFVFFDIECMQETGYHVPNLLVSQVNGSDEFYVFKREGCVGEFLDWLNAFSLSNEGVKIVVVAHNMQGYDGYMIVEEYYKRHIFPSMIVNGAKIMSMEMSDDIKFIDSLNFLPFPLSAFSKSFAIPELKKGFFPHFFNTQENQNYVGPIPDQKYYDPEGMSASRKAEFETWYNEQVSRNVLFNFQEEILAYCKSDVQLLRVGCETFMHDFEEIVGANPMAKRITIASACQMAYRMNWLPPKTIAVEPINGWRPDHNHSKVALEWLLFCENELQQTRGERQTPYIQHAGNSGERVLIQPLTCTKRYVDGWDEQTRTVYEMQGCFYHGCVSCFPKRSQKHTNHGGNKTMQDVRESTQDRVEELRREGYNVIEIWECQWTEMKKSRPDVKEFVEQLDITSPLNPRDAFFGGRTNAICLGKQVDSDEKILYDDICSLYPWVNKNCLYPVGHPVMIDHPQSVDLSSYFGIAKVKVVPPRGLYHPVLPYRYGKKLTFPLCAACLEHEQSKKCLHHRSWKCDHDDESRALVGTWCTPELEKAVEKGYRILYVYEIWNFPQSSNTLFTEYINTFLKLKVEASGWPSEVRDDPVKQEQYLDDFFEREGIRLDPDQIERNEGLRALAKLMLNSFWGKFGQRPNMTRCKQFNSPAQFFKFLSDDEIEVSSLQLINEEIIEVFYTIKKDCDESQSNVNIFIACFTTCWARLKLYESLDLLQERVLYFDTDSVVYTHKEGQPLTARGNFLGDFEPELPENDHIVEFVSAGPKNYAYTTLSGKQCCKVRGFTLNTRGSRVLHFESMKQLIQRVVSEEEEEDASLTLKNPHKLIRNQQLKKIQTVKQDKQYRLVYDKRVIDFESLCSFPYGYQ